MASFVGRKRRGKRVLTIDDYFEWLLLTFTDIADETLGETYIFIAKVMFSTPFEVLIERDDNRVGDAEFTRKVFKQDLDPECDGIVFGEKVSVFEILIELAKRLEFELFGSMEFVRTVPECFFLLLCNLGLDKYSDQYIASIRSKTKLNLVYKEIHDIIDVFVYRKYDRRGIGSAFPLREDKYDQRETELWYQMCGYVMENFDFRLAK